jgi:hypothetical protein
LTSQPQIFEFRPRTSTLESDPGFFSCPNPSGPVLHALFFKSSPFGSVSCCISYKHPRVASSLPDGDYEYVPQAEQTEEQPTQTDVQLHRVAAVQDLTQNQEEPAAQQVEGKPRCIPPYVKTTRTYV